MKSVLFVCTANQCRSPMAEVLLREKVSQLGEDGDWHISSAGTWAQPDAPAMPLTVQVMKQRGLDLSTHRARAIDEALLRSVNLVLVMTGGHRESLVVEFPTQADKIYLLSEMWGPTFDIKDPVGGAEADYQACAKELTSLIDKGFERIAAKAKA